MTESTTYKLAHPIKDGAETITEVRLRRLTLGDLRELEIQFAGDGAMRLRMGALLDCAAKVLGWDPQLVDRLDPVDAMGIGKVVAEGFRGLAL